MALQMDVISPSSNGMGEKDEPQGTFFVVSEGTARLSNVFSMYSACGAVKDKVMGPSFSLGSKYLLVYASNSVKFYCDYNVYKDTQNCEFAQK